MINNLLIIEDDENKRGQIVALIRELLPNCSVCEERSFQSGLKRLLADSFDLLLLDMTLPTFDRGPIEAGGRIRPFAGREILEQLARRAVRVLVVVVSGFELLGDERQQMTLVELDKELAARFNEVYRGFIYYNPAHSEWRSRLETTIRRLAT